MTVPGKYQPSYEKLLTNISCGPSDLDKFSGDAIACFRSASADTILEAVTHILEGEESMVTAAEIPWFPVQDGDFHRMYPTEALRTGNVAVIPTIIGE